MKSVPSDVYDKHYYLTINDGGALGKQDNVLSPRLSYIATLADITKGDVVLDIGCGTGEIVFYAAQQGATAYGVDYSKDAIDLCKKKHKKAPKKLRDLITFLHGSATKLGTLNIPKGKITKVIMTDVVEHLYPPELTKAMQEIHALVADDAVTYIHTAPNLHFYTYGYPIIRFCYPVTRHIPFVRNIIETKPNWKGRKRLPKNPEEGSHGNFSHVNEQTPQMLRDLCKDTGFDYKVWTLPFLRDVYGFTVKMTYLLFKIPPLNFAFCSEIVCLARKRKKA